MIEGFETIKKGTKLITKQLGVPTRATSMESIKQGRGFKNGDSGKNYLRCDERSFCYNVRRGRPLF